MGKVQGEKVGFDPVFKEHRNNWFLQSREIGIWDKGFQLEGKGSDASVYARPLFHTPVGLVISGRMAWLSLPSPSLLPLLMPVQWEPGTHWQPCEGWLHARWCNLRSLSPSPSTSLPRVSEGRLMTQSLRLLVQTSGSIVKEMFEIKHHYYIPSSWVSSLGPQCFWVKAQTRTRWRTFPLRTTRKEGPFLANRSWRPGAQSLYTVAWEWHLTCHCFPAF